MNTADHISQAAVKLFEAIHVFELETDLKPKKHHYGSHIKLHDFAFNRRHLIDQLCKTIVDWVFTKQMAKAIWDEEYGPNCDLSSASAALFQSAKDTFRVEAPQGQFGELLLNCFLQHLFGAVPLLRKQVVRTSDNHERFGADAIHYSNVNGSHLYLGESKCYKSSYQFPNAFNKSLLSINGTINNFADEIKKFKAGDFLEDGLKDVANNVLRNKLDGLVLHPVSIIIYNETTQRVGGTPEACLNEIKQAIIKQCEKVKTSVYDGVSQIALGRMVYILMPVWDLDSLLEEFVDAL